MQSLDLSLYPKIELPRFVKVKQHFDRQKLDDIPGEIQKNMAPYLENLSGKRIAVGVGSRGIHNIDLITKCVVDQLKQAGAHPFIIPAMGSHGGATPEGQAEILEAYGISEETMGVEIDASMDVESIGEIEPGLEVYVAKSALEADGIVIIPRIKAHTAFRGEVESGICKMLVIGLGKQAGTDLVHRQGFGRFAELIPSIGRMIAEKTRFLFSVSIVENAYEETYKIEVIPKQDAIALEREKALLEESKNKMGKILFPKFDVLVIEQIGKNISGDGQDPNVTGLYITKFASGGPEFQNCVIFDLTEETHGNANGVGTADVITRKLFDKIDFISMYTNAFTSTESAPVKIPMVASTPEDALRIAVKMCNGIEPYRHKIVWIKNTLELGEIIISEPLLEEARANPNIEISSEPVELTFANGEPLFHC
ncbi:MULTISPECIES: lactate racemase domain-containing protein [Paenibacillus]|uniref:lactate racemase domain-containing protein n=1 Tax=Paenibacillus TaxID=44249 RepID=UPI00078321A6|nr:MULTISPECIES: lactate racemase domain-containing protein [Paenibacillus]GCL71552.1 DUF2088 domain-containing protein [Paenibacillus naphthalenovorans]